MKSLLLFVLLLLANAAAAQTTPISVSFVQTVSTNYEISPADRNRFKPVEIVGFKPEREVHRVTISTNAGREVSATIEVLEAPAREAWEKPAPSKILIDKSGVRLYDNTQKLMTTDVLSASNQAVFQSFKTNLLQNGLQPLPVFNPLTDADILRLQQNGFQTSTLENGAVQLRKGDTKIVYDHAAMSVRMTHYTGTAPLVEITTKYRQQNGQIIPATKTERHFESTASGLCYQRVTSTEYSNYTRTNLP